MVYSKVLKDAMVSKMLAPNNQSISEISKKEGMPQTTLRKWRDGANARDKLKRENYIFMIFCRFYRSFRFKKN